MNCCETHEISAKQSWGLWKLLFTPPEFRILDFYLSHIDLEHPENRTVHIGKGVLEQLLNVSDLTRAHLKEVMQDLGTAIVDTPHE